jgi:hypothetical protein
MRRTVLTLAATAMTLLVATAAPSAASGPSRPPSSRAAHQHSGHQHSGHGHSADGAEPEHVDPAPPGVDPRTPVSARTLIRRSGVQHRPAVLTRRRPSSGPARTAADANAPGARLSVPAGRPGSTALTQHVAPSCVGNGTDGNRVQVLYAYPAGSTNRLDVPDAGTGQTLRTALQSYVADVDDTFALSSGQTGRRVRWVFDPATCLPKITAVAIPAGTLSGTDSGLTAIGDAAAAAGLPVAARKLLTFTDAHDLCGIGEIYSDDTAAASNANNDTYTMIARVDQACWAMSPGWHSTAAHELMHMLGGVQNGAPHATSFGHCTDENDVMCYTDGGTMAGGLPAVMHTSCSAWGAEALFDCGRDDYFSTGTPPAGSYLAGHWNTAASSYLDVVPAAPAPSVPNVTISGPATLHPGLAATLTATADEPGTFGWSTDLENCLGANRTSASVRLQCVSDASGDVAVTVIFRTPDGRVATLTRSVSLTGPAAALSVGLAAPAQAYVGGAATLTASVRSGTAPVRALLSAQRRVLVQGTWAWQEFDTAVTGSAGTASVAAPAWDTLGARSYRVQVRAGPAGGWTSTSSPSRTVTTVLRTLLTSSARTGRPSTVRALLRTSAGAAVRSRVVVLQYRTSGATRWRTLARHTTGTTGTARALVHPGRPTSYRWIFAGSAGLGGSTSRSIGIRY